MKKYAIILGLSLVAGAAMGQETTLSLGHGGPTPPPPTILTSNNATLTQLSGYQMANIQQCDSYNTAVVWQQGKTTGDNGSWLQGNYLFLKQDGGAALGILQANVTQVGLHNFAALNQIPVNPVGVNTITVNQIGDNNIIADYNPLSKHKTFCTDLPVWTPDPCLIDIPSPYEVVTVKGILSVDQIGDRNSFLTAGNTLKGKTDIKQVGNDNRIFLDKLSSADLAIYQIGNTNLTALKFDGKQASYVNQVGNNNFVGKYNFGHSYTVNDCPSCNPCPTCPTTEGLCANCPSDFGTFNGDKLAIEQIGDQNRISLESTSISSNVTITQRGNFNGARVLQGK